MFKKFKVLKESAIELYPYFTPSYNNCVRTAGFITAVVVIPIANFFMIKLFLNKVNSSEDSSNNFDVITALTSASGVALLNGAQQALSMMLMTSTTQAMKEQNIKLLMDDSKFLMHGNNKDLSSLQYVTVGVGVRDFATSAVPIFVSLPAYTITAASTLINIANSSGSLVTSGVVFSFISAAVIAQYVTNKENFLYQASNQKIENELVGKVGFIESHRGTIPLIGASEAECKSIMQSLHIVNSSIPKLTCWLGFNSLFTTLSPAIASQFLGGYYKGELIQNINDPSAKVLNVALMSLMTNIQNITWILTANYSYTELNLEQLNAFSKAYSNCVLTRNTYNKMIQKFEGDHLSLSNFSIYKPDADNTQNSEFITVLDQVNLELLPNKIYKLLATSGSGKTTFFKAITNNWQYTDGIVTLPVNAKNNICFIPQDPFIPPGTLLEILTYPLTPKEFVATYFSSTFTDAVLEAEKKDIEAKDDEDKVVSNSLLEPLIKTGESNAIIQDNSILALLDNVKHLLILVKLLPNVIREEELEFKNINWNDRLSGGEKQKLGVIRALLSNPKFIIMDEATSALDQGNKQTIYQLVKNYTTKLENYTIIYSEHGVTESFADSIIVISGQSLEYYDV